MESLSPWWGKQLFHLLPLAAGSRHWPRLAGPASAAAINRSQGEEGLPCSVGTEEAEVKPFGNGQARHLQTRGKARATLPGGLGEIPVPRGPGRASWGPGLGVLSAPSHTLAGAQV